MIGNYSGRVNVINAPELEVVDDQGTVMSAAQMQASDRKWADLDQGEEERYEVRMHSTELVQLSHMLESRSRTYWT